MEFVAGDVFEEPSRRILMIMMPAYLLYFPVRGVAVPVLMGLGKLKGITTAILLAGLMNLVLSVLLVRPLGLDGVAWGTAIPTYACAMTLAVLLAGEIELSVWLMVRNIGFPALTAFVTEFTVLSLLRQWHAPLTFFELGAAGFTTVGLAAMLWVGFVWRNDPDFPLPNPQQLLRTRMAW